MVANRFCNWPRGQFVFGVQPTDPTTLVAVILTITLVIVSRSDPDAEL